jgi:hypothetical protein
MIIKHIISTLNSNSIHEILDRLNIGTDAVVINQCDKESMITINFKENKIQCINTKDRGISKSRNLGIKNITSDIVIISDDNIKYTKNYLEIIEKVYKENPSYDIIAFNIRRSDDRLIKKTKGRIGYLKSMRISSPQLTFKINVIENKKIYFDEEFGTGTNNYMGEENIFLYDCLKNNIRILSVDTCIGEKLNIRKSTWFSGFNKKYFNVKGACFFRMSKLFCNFLIFQFAIRKLKYYGKEINLFQAFIFLFEGKKKYIKSIYNKGA